MDEMLRVSEYLEPGDVVPNWELHDGGGHPFSLRHDSIAGSTMVVVFLPTGSPKDKAALPSLAHQAQLKAAGVRLFVIVAATAAKLEQHETQIPVLTDVSRQVWRSFGKVHADAFAIVLTRNCHVADVFGLEDGAFQRAIDVAEALESRARNPHANARPPVLQIPEVLSAAECRALVDNFETKGQTYLEKTVAADYLGTDYKIRIPEHMREDRVDHFFFEKDTVAFLMHRMNRVIPEIKKAFHYDVTKFETLRVARYRGARNGFCHGHRDDIPQYSYRRFAMSINLNSHEFDGGELRFPEFGDALYKPDAGEAIVFSSTLLHEAREVRAGTRYVLLAFMF